MCDVVANSKTRRHKVLVEYHAHVSGTGTATNPRRRNEKLKICNSNPPQTSPRLNCYMKK